MFWYFVEGRGECVSGWDTWFFFFMRFCSVYIRNWNLSLLILEYFAHPGSSCQCSAHRMGCSLNRVPDGQPRRMALLVHILGHHTNSEWRRQHCRRGLETFLYRLLTLCSFIRNTQLLLVTVNNTVCLMRVHKWDKEQSLIF